MPAPKPPDGVAVPRVAKVPTLSSFTARSSLPWPELAPQRIHDDEDNPWDWTHYPLPEDSLEMHRPPRETLRRISGHTRATKAPSMGRPRCRSMGQDVETTSLDETGDGPDQGATPNIPLTSSQLLGRFVAESLRLEDAKALVPQQLAKIKPNDNHNKPASDSVVPMEGDHPLIPLRHEARDEGQGLSAYQQCLIDDVIAARVGSAPLAPPSSDTNVNLVPPEVSVENSKFWKGDWREELGEHISNSGHAAFGVSRLGIPSGGSSSSTAVAPPESTGNSASMETSRPERSCLHVPPKSEVRYISIPKHALSDFRDFAKDVAREATREVAASNPYAQALSRHREELETPLVVETVTKEQQLGIQREALCVLKAVSLLEDPVQPMLAPQVLDFGMCYGHRDLHCRAPQCEGGPCCETRGELLRVEPSVTDVVIAHPVLGDPSTPCSSRSHCSVHSAISTTCSRRSSMEDRARRGLCADHSKGRDVWDEHYTGL